MLLKDNPPFTDSGFFANSISTVAHLPSHGLTTETPIAQLSAVENCIFSQKRVNTSKGNVIHRKSPATKIITSAKSNQALYNHIGEATGIRAMPRAKLANEKQVANSTHSLQSLNIVSTPNSRSSSCSELEQSARKAPPKRRRIVTPATRSVSSLRWMDMAPFGRGARSAVNICEKAEIPDIHNTPRRYSRPTNLEPSGKYDCCRECERIQSKQRIHSSARSSIVKLQKSITSVRTSSSSFPSDDAEPSPGSGDSSSTEARPPQRLSKKCYYDISPDDVLSSPYQKFSLQPKPVPLFIKCTKQSASIFAAQKSEGINSEGSHSELVSGRRKNTAMLNADWSDSSKKDIQNVCRCEKSTRLPIKVPTDSYSEDDVEEEEEVSNREVDMMEPQPSYSPRINHNIAIVKILQSGKPMPTPNHLQLQKIPTKCGQKSGHQKITSV